MAFRQTNQELHVFDFPPIVQVKDEEVWAKRNRQTQKHRWNSQVDWEVFPL